MFGMTPTKAVSVRAKENPINHSPPVKVMVDLELSQEQWAQGRRSHPGLDVNPSPGTIYTHFYTQGQLSVDETHTDMHKVILSQHYS